jgi:hypothetical protein
MGKIKRYWTQLGFTEDQAAVNRGDFMEKTAPWSGITQCYMEDLLHKSSIFKTGESLYSDKPRMVCTLLISNQYNFRYNFARTHYLGFYFDHEFK